MAINESKIASVVNALMEDYGKGRVIDEIKMFDYPDRAVIIDLLEKLKIIIYPGITATAITAPTRSKTIFPFCSRILFTT